MVRRITAEERQARIKELEAQKEAQKRAIELKNTIIAKRLLTKSPNILDEEKTIYLSPSRKISGIDLMILSDSPEFNTGKGEEDCFNENRYFVHMDGDAPYVFCEPAYGQYNTELIKNMCGIANREQLCVYGNFNGTPIIVEPNEPYDTAYQYFENVEKFSREIYTSYSKYIEETFVPEHDDWSRRNIEVSDYAKAKKQAQKFSKENPEFPFSEELVAYAIVCARKSNLGDYGKEIPSLIRLLGRDAQLTEKALRCLEIGQSEHFPLVFNKDKIKELSESRVSQGAQTHNRTNATNRTDVRQ